MPHDHGHVLADWHKAAPRARRAGDRRRRARRTREWAQLALGGSRGRVPEGGRAARHDAGAPTLNAATMLGQSKTAFQAEIDAACELIDFWRFNPHYAQELYDEQPISRPQRCGTSSTTAPLEGFVYAVTPFNFTAIGGNLPTAPALMGNTVLWKPASTAMLSALLHHEAARGGGAAAGRDQLRARRRGDDLATSLLDASRPGRRALHRQHRRLQQHVEDDRREHGALPLAIRASSARRAARTSSSRTRRPTRRRSPWRSRAAASSTRARSARRRAASTCRARSGTTCATATVGDDRATSRWATSRDFRNFMGAVIDQKAFDKIGEYLADAKQNAHDRRRRRRRRATKGYFIEPTLVETDDPGYRLLCEEIFGPVVTALRLRRREVGGDAARSSTRRRPTRSPARCSRSDRRAVREATIGAAQRGRQLLHQRQADGRGGRPAAVRRRARARARTTRRARS